ncbi:hypothetical protein WAF17_20365 [Bernardetia sp. ABR2-2B]|uniref:hypothetical protein n=1 Tax=Bernardetia sp. ABR2-2B TaxID=3127472 RepID=UPI0030D18F6D
MKDTILFLKIFLLGIITVTCFVISFLFLYSLISQLGDFSLEKYVSFQSSTRSRINFLVGINMVLFLFPLLISLFSFKMLRKIYNSLSQ